MRPGMKKAEVVHLLADAVRVLGHAQELSLKAAKAFEDRCLRRCRQRLCPL